MECHLLVVPVNSVVFVESVGAVGLAEHALPQVVLGFVVGIVEKRAFNVSALAPEIHFVKFWKHIGSLSDYSTDFN